MPELEYKREIRLLQYMVEQIVEVEEHTLNLNERLFLKNDLVKNASLLKLIFLSEHSVRLNNDLKNNFHDVPWKFIEERGKLQGINYHELDWRIIWEVVAVELPVIKPKIEHIIEELEKEKNAKAN